jgi:AraC-like DNA-binding protein
MLQDLVNISGLSKYYLIRKFEQEYGISPHQYLTSLRINHARKIMRRNKNISDVALEAGFYDQSHFTKTFKEHTGITPMKYLNDISR